MLNSNELTGLKARTKSCPYCGSDRLHIEDHSRVWFTQDGTKEKVLKRSAFVECKNCLSRGPCVPINTFNKTSHSGQARAVAVDMWNRVAQIVIDDKIRRAASV